MLGSRKKASNSKITPSVLLIGFLVAGSVIILTTPLHEAAHWVMSDIDPYVEPVEIHVFDDLKPEKENHVLSSALGYVVIQEEYKGAFNHRPFWADILQEIICLTIQIVIAVFITLKTLEFFNRYKNKKNFFVNTI